MPLDHDDSIRKLTGKEVFWLGQTANRRLENGLIEIFLSVCGPSTPAPSCWDERRRQTSRAAAAVLLGRVAALVAS